MEIFVDIFDFINTPTKKTTGLTTANLRRVLYPSFVHDFTLSACNN